MKTKLQLTQEIGNVVCENCGQPDNDCGFIIAECSRIVEALVELDNFLKERLLPICTEDHEHIINNREGI